MRAAFLAILFASFASLVFAQCKDGSSQFQCGPKTYCCCSSVDPNAQACTSKGATSCRNNYVLVSGKCLPTCPARTYRVGGGCANCKDGNAQTCDGNGSATSCANGMALYNSACVSTCPQKTFRANNQCNNCADGNAITCTSQQATSCGGSTSLYQGRCVNPCPDTFFSSGNVCQACTGNAQTCNASGALSCKSGFFLNGNTCVSSGQCPTGTYPKTSTNTCAKCIDSDAKTCDANGVALTCGLKNLYKGACIATCPSDYYTIYASHVCTACGTNEATCDKNGALSCKAGFLYNKACISSCSTGFYGDTKALACVPCSNLNANAATCQYTSGAGSISSCKNGFGLSQGTCVNPCPSRTYLAASGICTACKDTDATVCNADFALKCTFKYLTPMGACAATCPDGYYADLATHTCIKCKDTDAKTCSSTKALSCKVKFLEDGACVSSCAMGAMGDPVKHVCTSCPQEDAASCDANGATSCATKYLSNKACVDVCPGGTFPNEELKECTSCGDGIALCTRDVIQACGVKADGTQLYLENGACVAQCKDGFYGGALVGSKRRLAKKTRISKRAPTSIVAPTCQKCPDGAATCSSLAVALTCTTNAAGTQTFLNAASTSCVVAEQCASLTFASSTDSKFLCADCPTGSTACSATGEATACAAPLLVSVAKCVATCPVSTFKNKGVCSACGDSALQCTSATTATACGKNKAGVQTYLLNGKCQLAKECPNAWGYIDEKALACKRCDQFSPGSVTCNADGALSCGKLAGVQQYLTPNKNCVAALACPSSFWANPKGFVCTACDDGTKTCTKNSAGGSVDCSTSSAGDAMYLDMTSSTCVKTCPEAFYPDSLSAKCLACKDGEKKCTGNGSGLAVSCKAGRFLTPAKECVTSSGCASLGAYFGNTNTVDPVCSLCDPGVLACTGNGDGAATKCGIDPPTQVQLFLDPSNNCVAKEDCPIATFINDADNTCTKCQKGALLCLSTTDASQCGTVEGVTYFLDNGVCVSADQRTEGTGPSTESGACQDCDDLFEHSVTCSRNEATRCDDTTFLYSGACIATCPSTTYADTTARTCVSCVAAYGSGTATCDASGSFTCVENAFKVNGRCRTCGELFPGSTSCSENEAFSCATSHALQGGQCWKVYSRSVGWGYAYRERPANNEAECAVISATTWDWTTWQANNGKCYAINGPFSNGFIRPEAMWNVFHDAQIDNACNLGPGNCQLVYFVGRNCYVYGSNAQCNAYQNSQTLHSFYDHPRTALSAMIIFLFSSSRA